jgi:hypothetical protein
MQQVLLSSVFPVATGLLSTLIPGALPVYPVCDAQDYCLWLM